MADDLQVEITEDGTMVLNGTITNPKIVKAIREAMRKGGDPEEVLRQMLTNGVTVLKDSGNFGVGKQT